MKVIKRFTYEGVELRIAERMEQCGCIEMAFTRVLTPNGHAIPVHFQYRDTRKQMVATVTEFLDSIKARGIDVQKQLIA